MQKLSISEWLWRAGRAIINGAATLSYICVTGILLIVIANVIFRYLVQSPIFGGDEITINLMIIMVYVASAIVLAEDRHIRMGVILDRVPTKVKNVLMLIMSLIGTGYAGFLSYAVILLTIDTRRTGTYSGTTGWPVSPWQMVIVAGLLALTVAFIMLVIARVGVILGIRKEKKLEGKEVLLWD